MPEGGIVIDLRFKVRHQNSKCMMISLEDLRGSVAIETVPLSEQPRPTMELPKIGTWPTPEKSKTVWRWFVNVNASSPTYHSKVRGFIQNHVESAGGI